MIGELHDAVIYGFPYKLRQAKPKIAAIMAFAETALVLLRLLISGIIGLIVLFTNGYVRVPKYTLVSQRVWLARLDNTRIGVLKCGLCLVRLLLFCLLPFRLFNIVVSHTLLNLMCSLMCYENYTMSQ